MERNYKITEKEVVTKNIFNEKDEKMVNHLIHKMLGLDDSVELDDNLKESPHRWCKLWTEMTEGYRTDPKSYLEKCFPLDTPNMADDPEKFNEEKTASLYQNGIVMVSTEAWSNCIHHLAPMHGEIFVLYIPDKKVVGLSKIVRMVKMYGRRLNLQEGWMNNIADAMMEVLEPLGVMVYFRDMTHSCVAMRGSAEQTSRTNSIAVRGVFIDPKVKNEGLMLVNNSK
jgi:GTP cyclohydrolase I